MIALIWPFLQQRMIAIGVVAALAAVVFTWDHKRANRHRAEGAAKVVQASKQEGNRRNETAQKRRARVPASAAKRRLREEFARDR